MDVATIESWTQCAICIITPWIPYVLSAVQVVRVIKGSNNKTEEKLLKVVEEIKNERDELRQENEDLKELINCQQNQIDTLTKNQIQLQKDITRVLEKRVD